MAIGITSLIAILALAGGAAYVSKQVKDTTEIRNDAGQEPLFLGNEGGFFGGQNMMMLLPLAMMLMTMGRNKSDDKDTYIIFNDDDDEVNLQ